MVRRIALVLVVVALVVLALIAAIHTPMVQRGLCRRLEMLLTDQLDRPVTVRALRFSFLGAIHVEDFSIANPPEFPGLMLQVEDLSAALDLSALLHGRLSILKLTLEHPTFTYFQDAEGNDNMPAGGGESTTPKSDPRQGLETVFNKISAASAVIRDGVFRLELAREELNLTVSGIHIDIRGNASTNRYATAIDLRDIRFTLADILHLDGRITGMVEAGAGGCSSRGVKVSLQDEAVLLDIAAVELDDYFDPRLRIHARLTTSMEALEHIFHFDAPVKAALSMELILSGPPDSMAGTAVLEVDDARVDKLAVQHLRAEMEYREEHIRFTSLNAQTSGGMLKGVGDLDFGKEPGLSFDMNLENVDLAQVLASYEADVLADRMEWSGAGVFSLPDFDAARMSITGEVWHGLQGPKRTTRAGIPFAAHAPFRIDENSLSSSLISLQLPGGNIRIDSFRMGFDGPISAGIQADLVDMRKVAQTIAEQTKLLATLATTLPPISGQASLRGTVGGTLDAPALTGVLVLDTAAIDQFTVRTMRMPFNYSADSLAWDMTRIDLEAGGITTRGMLNLAAPGGRAFDTAMLPAGRLEIGSSGLQLAPIAHLLDIGPLSGELDLHITYDVSEAASAVQLDVQGKQISFDPIAADTVQIAAHLAEGEVIIDNASVGIGSGAVKFSGRIRSDASITAGGTIRDLDLARALVVEGLAVEGKVNGTAAVSGSLSAPTADLDLSLDTLAVAGLPLFNLAVEAELTAPEMLNLRIKSEAEELAAAIRIALSGDVPVDGSLTLRGIDVDPFLTAAGAESGTIVSKIDLDASITGFLADPSRLTATASLSRLDMEIAGKTITAVEPLVANWNGSELVIDPTRLKGDYLDLSMSGLVTLDGRPDLRISGSLDMAILKALTTEIEQPAGRTQFELGLQDSFEEPRLKGDITIEEAAFRVKMLNKWVRDLHAHATVNGKMVTMDYLIGMFDEAILDGTGRIGLDGWSPRYLEANLTAAGVELDYPPGVYSAFDADLRAVGKLDELLIDGRVLLDKAVYYQRIDYKSMIVEESQAVLTVQTRAVQGDVREAVGSPRFNVDIMAPDNIFVQNNLADLELKADLTLSGTAAAPLLFGQVSVLGGMVIYEDREFIIDTATIDFIDTKEINPMFDIRANAVIDAYTLGLSVAGKLYGDFTINLNSDPPLSEVDLWSLLVLGKTTDNLKSQGAGYTTAHATSLLTGRIQDEIEKRVKILGGFDEFQITPIVSDSGANAAARFTAKKTIGDRLSVTYSTELSSTSQQLLMVEYQLTDHIVLLGERTETGSLGGNLIFRFALP